MAVFETLDPQPNFPTEDLSETNASFIRYFLINERSDQSYALFLRPSLRMLHVTGHSALQICGIEVDYSEREYAAFCAGFAALEYTTHIVRRSAINTELAARATKRLFIDAPDMADVEIADRFTAWKESHPNTHGTIVDAGAEQGETMKQLHVRAIGAEMAWELQSVA